MCYDKRPESYEMQQNNLGREDLVCNGQGAIRIDA